MSYNSDRCPLYSHWQPCTSHHVKHYLGAVKEGQPTPELVGVGWPSVTKNVCRSIAKLCYLNKMLCSVKHSSIPLSKPRIMDSRFRNFCDSMLLQAFARINSYEFSFYPTSISLSNHLPAWVCDRPNLSSFKIICVFISPDVFLCYNFPCIICRFPLLGLPSN